MPAANNRYERDCQMARAKEISWWADVESDHEPHSYQECVLPLNYPPGCLEIILQ